MSNNPRYRIDFYQIRNRIEVDSSLQIDEMHEAIERSIFIIESLVFFITSTSKVAIDELDYESYSIYLGNINELIEAFGSFIANHSLILEERRNELEEIVSKLPKV